MEKIFMTCSEKENLFWKLFKILFFQKTFPTLNIKSYLNNKI